MRYLPEGMKVDEAWAAASRACPNQSSSSGTPIRPAIASQMNDCVGRAADGGVGADRVLKGVAGEDLRHAQIFWTISTMRRPVICARVSRRASTAGMAALPGRRHAQRFDHAGHGGGGAHGHAVAFGACMQLSASQEFCEPSFCRRGLSRDICQTSVPEPMSWP